MGFQCWRRVSGSFPPLQSGVFLSPFAVQPTPLGLHFSKELAGKLDCATNDHGTMLACIRERKDADIQKASDFRT